MEMRLNETPQIYKTFQGIPYEQIPQLIAEKRTPLTISDIMQKRVDVVDAEQEVKDGWWNNYFDTTCAIAYHPEEKIKIILNSDGLKSTNLETKLKNGMLALSADEYKSLKGPELFKKDIEKYIGNWLSQKEAILNPIWSTLAINKETLRSYIDLIYDNVLNQSGSRKSLKVLLWKNSNVPIIHQLRLGKVFDGSPLSGIPNLDISGSCYIGKDKYTLVKKYIS